MSNTRLAAARARARGRASTAEHETLAGLDPLLWRTVDVDGHIQVALTAEWLLHHADVSELPVSRLVPTQAKALLGLLLAARADGPTTHPFPGRPTTIRRVLDALGGANLNRGQVAHLKGALKRLHLHRLAVVGDSDVVEPLTLDDATPTTLGPAVASWDGPWLRDLQLLLDEITDTTYGDH